jgi:glucosamine--fructose-6-phosphate aminotransferase (isomerizing)
VNDKSLVIGLLGIEQPEHELRVLEDMKDLGGKILAIGDKEKVDPPAWIDYFIPIQPSLFNPYGDILYMPTLQMLAYEKALTKGLDPDNPQNLSAVVTLEL